MPDTCPVLVIGAGFTGTVLAVQLRRLGVPALLLDPAPPGPGLAYGTADPLHLLNVPAKAMSAFAEEPGHFLDWLARQDATELGPLCPEAGPDAFAPRCLYGRYLRELASGLEHRPVRVESLRREGADWVAEPGGLRGRAAALCLGNPPPAPAFGGPGVIADPWAPGALSAIGPGEEVLVLGTGLTMADAVLTLKARLGHAAPVTALSRHGWAPLAHAAPPLPAPRPAPPLPVAQGVAAMARALRAACREAPWQAGLDGFRPQLQHAWQAMDGPARARFLRHGRTAWNIHRHRLPPAVAARLAQWEAQGALRRRAGRLRAFAPGAAVLAGGASLPARHLLLCTGPENGAGLLAQPLVAALAARGWLAPDPHGLGLLPGPAAPDGLHLLGPATRASLWEATAVPELRAQAAEAARRILAAASTPGGGAV
ncbi:FAD/NAD(P)-binding protein [Roseococcus sp. DSY-14]|uniref:FAD/NAD(P)-binding protein n=1 Tax=Roseococcus sp. DSY-14 TaxID=3369650 RepID=UPI00387B0D46